MKISSLSAAVAILALSSCSKVLIPAPQDPPVPGEPEPAGNYIQTPISSAINSNIGGFLEALPPGYANGSQEYPLLIFLHGMGELGNGSANELNKASRNGTPALIKRGNFPASFVSNGRRFSFIVISPQFRDWPGASDVKAVIDYAVAHYRVDETRIYCAGLSMGGGATWDLAALHGTKLAAIVPICGATSPSDDKARKIAQSGTAVWAFHNNDDPTVAASNSTGFVEKINRNAPAIPAKLTLWPSGGHNAWTRATDPSYRENGLNMYEWMLQYSR